MFQNKKDILKRKRGLSNVVSTILLVLLTFSAVVIVAGILIPFVRDSLNEGSECLDYRDYFTDANLWNVVESPLRKLKSINRFKATVIVRGGGKSGQADAIKHGLARTLVEFDGNFRKKLKKSGYLIRDPRAKERRKYGLKKARKAPRWSKR